MKITLLILFISFNCLGQTAVYNKLSEKGIFEQYQTKDGLILKNGDAIKIGYPLGQDFTFITQGDLQVSARLSNSEVSISKIKSIGNPVRGYKIYLFFKGYGINCAIDYESALETGEINNPASYDIK
jgi:hypothetical protein